MNYAYLIDDEPLALSHMRETIPWHENEFEVIGSSTDPLRAIEEVKELKPDVVFTDIRMAPISGLELIARLREAEPEILFVVVSAHDRFEYARSVIHMQGFDYLIKPVEVTQYTELFIRLGEQLAKKTEKKERKLTTSVELNLIVNHLAHHFSKRQTLNQIAKQFNISPNYICRLFSKHLNVTFSAYLSKLRMDHAADLLHHTDKPVKEISSLCGYEDYFYFCRVFRDAYGQTPTQFRSNT